MMLYEIELTKKIVVALESDGPMEEVVAEVIDDDSGFDGAWDRTETTGVVTYIMGAAVDKNVSKMTVEELHRDGYVCVVFQPGDVKSLRESWSENKCIEQLAANAKYVNDRLIELGWDVLDTLIDPADPLPKCNECGNGFDDNPGKPICKTCEDWMVEGKA